MWGQRPDFYYCQATVGLLMWSTFCDKRTDLSFKSADGLCQCSQCRVREPAGLMTIFYSLRFKTLQTWRVRSSYLHVYPLGTGFPFHRLLQLAGLWWRYANMPPHVFCLWLKDKIEVMLRPTVIPQVCLGVKPHLGPKTSFLLLSDSCGFVDMNHLLRRQDRSVIYNCWWHSLALWIQGSSPHIYIPQERGGPVIPAGTGFPFHHLLWLAVFRWRYSNPPPHGFRLRLEAKIEVYVTSDGQSASLSWCQAPSGA
jgi:hypothetical protein